MRAPLRTQFRKRRHVQRDIAALIERLRKDAQAGLHLGCGPHRIEGLLNCDLFDPSADRKIGVTDLSEFADGSIDYIEANHVIEHLSFAEAAIAFKEWSRVLKREGVLVVSCPDFDRLVRRWVSRPRDRFAETIKMVYGSQEHEGMYHKSGYNGERLSALLGEVSLVPELVYTPYPPRPTPSLCVLARKA